MGVYTIFTMILVQTCTYQAKNLTSGYTTQWNHFKKNYTMDSNSNLKTIAHRAILALNELTKKTGWNEWSMEDLRDFLIDFALREKHLSSPIVPEVIEWEYAILSHYLPSIEELNSWGKLGWELCYHNSERKEFYFKRKKQKP